MKITIDDKRSCLWQWDTGRYISVSNTTASDIDMCRSGEQSVYTVTLEDGKALIPDRLLAASGSLLVFVRECDTTGKMTVSKSSFHIVARPKPDNYIYSPTEIKKWESLESRIDKLETDGDHSVLKNRDAADQHPIEAITGLKDDLYTPMRVELDLSEFEKTEGYLDNQGNPVEKVGFNGFFYKIPADSLPKHVIVAGYADYNTSSADRYTRWALVQDNGNINDYAQVNAESESCVYDTIDIRSELSHLYLAGNNDFPPKLFHIVDQSFPQIKGDTEVVWTTIWRWKDTDTTLNDDQGWRYTHEHNFWDYWNLAKQGKFVVARGLTGQPKDDSVGHELYGLYYLTSNSISGEKANGRSAYNVNFLRMSNFDVGWTFNSSDVNLQCERYVVLYRDGKTWSEMKYSFIPELPSDLTINRNYNDHYCVPAVQNAGFNVSGTPDITLLLSNVDFPTFTTTNTKEKFDYALAKAHEHPDLIGVDTLASTAPHLAHLTKYIIPHNLVNPDDNDIKLGWRFYNTSTTRMTGSGTAHWVTTGYIPVVPGKIYYLTETNCTVRAFASDKTFVKSSWTWLYTGKSRPTTGAFVTFADGIKYARFSFEDTYYDTSSTEDISTLNDYFLRNCVFVGEFIGKTYDFSSYENYDVDFVHDPAFWKSFDFSNLPSLKTFRWNLVDPSKISKGSLNDDNGEYVYSADTDTSFNRVTWFTPVEPNATYMTTANAAYCYDAAQTFLSKVDVVDNAFSAPDDTAFVRLTAASETDVPKMSLIVNGYGRIGLTVNSDVNYDECIPVFESETLRQAFRSYLDVGSGSSSGSGLTTEQEAALNANTTARHIHENKSVLDSITADKLNSPLGITGASVGQVPQVASVDADGKPLTWNTVNISNEGVSVSDDSTTLFNTIISKENDTLLDFSEDTLGKTLHAKTIHLSSPSVANGTAETTGTITINDVINLPAKAFARTNVGSLYCTISITNNGLQYIYRGRDTDIVSNIPNSSYVLTEGTNGIYEFSNSQTVGKTVNVTITHVRTSDGNYIPIKAIINKITSVRISTDSPLQSGASYTMWTSNS